MIKAILSDFDGTLVREDGTYDPQLKELLATIRKKGIRFSVATGRSHIGRVKKAITDLGVDGIHILHGVS